jgi:hypothetical protein
VFVHVHPLATFHVVVEKKVKIAKRTHLSMQASINQKDMRIGNPPIKAPQAHSRLFKGFREKIFFYFWPRRLVRHSRRATAETLAKDGKLTSGRQINSLAKQKPTEAGQKMKWTMTPNPHIPPSPCLPFQLPYAILGSDELAACDRRPRD